MCKKLKVRCGGLIYLIFVLMLSFAVKSAFGELVAYYPMNEESGTEIIDASVYQRHAEAAEEPERVEGPFDFGGALFFDGANPAPTWVNCGTWNPSEDTGQLTVMLWLRWEGPNDNWQGVVAKRDGWGNEEDVMWYLEMSMNTGNVFFARMGQTAADANAPPIGQWQHVAVSYDGTTATMYADGEEGNFGEFSFGPGVDTTLMIGADNLGGFNGFNGTIDEVRLYDTALTQQEIQLAMFDTGAPLELAFAPLPKNNALDVPRDPVLSWRAGLFAGKHDVYFGAVADDVNEADRDNPMGVLVSQDQEETSYDPPGLLDYNQIYYWRIDEVNDLDPNSPWKGTLWSFQVLNFPVVIDDFEDYNDFPPNEVWNTWLDGFGDPTNGSTAGYPDPDFVIDEHYVETTIVHTGTQSLPLFYDNSVGLSEVTRSLSGSIADWTQEGVVTLTLFINGDAANEAEPVYIVVNGSAVVTNGDPDAVLVTEWTRWDIPLADITAQGVNLSNVGSLSIGLGNKANPVAGGSGVLYVDDIRLYRPD